MLKKLDRYFWNISCQFDKFVEMAEESLNRRPNSTSDWIRKNIWQINGMKQRCVFSLRDYPLFRKAFGDALHAVQQQVKF